LRFVFIAKVKETTNPTRAKDRKNRKPRQGPAEIRKREMTTVSEKIDAKLVKELREKSGAPMGDCLKAL